MAIIDNIALESNRNIEINFDGGDLSSDSGLFLMKEFIEKIGLNDIIDRNFMANDNGDENRVHTNSWLLLQSLFQIFGAYYADDRADYLRNEPVMTACLDKESLASQPTLSRFYSRMDAETEDQFNDILKELRKNVYSIEGRPNMIIFDPDTTLLETYGEQEGSAWNNHYKAEGYHPMVCFNAVNGDLLKVKLRNGSQYCSVGAADFMEPLLKEYTEDYPYTNMFARADSGFATPELYDIYEKYGVNYAIRLKENKVLRRLVHETEMKLFAHPDYMTIDRVAVYGEFTYQAGSWSHPRRVVVKVEKAANSLAHTYMFIVTNMSGSEEFVVNFYCGRGNMENYIKECKDDFDFGAVSSKSKVVNACRLQVHVLAYAIVNFMKRLVFPKSMRKDRMQTIRLKMVKIASRVIRHGRKTIYKLCSSCPYVNEFIESLQNIRALRIA